jgi:hypothetical protein
MAWAPITGSTFQDASGNLLVNGMITFVPTDANGNPIPAHAESGGLVIEQSSAPITNGVIANDYVVAPFLYTVLFVDGMTGLGVVLKGVTVTDAGINFDTYNPTLAASATMTSELNSAPWATGGGGGTWVEMFTPTAHEFLTGFNSHTGDFSAAQPAYSDLTGVPVLPNGSTATTQAADDDSANVATTQYTDSAVATALATALLKANDLSDVASPTAARTNLGLATVAASSSYNDLTNKPTIPAAQVNSDWNAASGVAEILNKPTIPQPGTTILYGTVSNLNAAVATSALVQSNFGQLSNANAGPFPVTSAVSSGCNLSAWQVGATLGTLSAGPSYAWVFNVTLNANVVDIFFYASGSGTTTNGYVIRLDGRAGQYPSQVFKVTSGVWTAIGGQYPLSPVNASTLTGTYGVSLEYPTYGTITWDVVFNGQAGATAVDSTYTPSGAIYYGYEVGTGASLSATTIGNPFAISPFANPQSVIALDNPVASGDLITMVLYGNGAGTTTGALAISDTLGSSWSLVASQVGPGACANDIEVYAAIAPTAGACTITLGNGASTALNSYSGYVLAEVQGCTATVDVSGGSYSVMSVGLTTTDTNDFIIAALDDTLATTVVPGSGFTAGVGGSCSYEGNTITCGFAYATIATAGALTASFTGSDFIDPCMLVVAFKGGTGTSAVGADGDWYFNTATDTLYGPRVSGVWPVDGFLLTGVIHSGAAPAPVVQQSAMVATTSAEPFTYTLTTKNVTAGNLIVVVVMGEGTSIPNTGYVITDNLGSGTYPCVAWVFTGSNYDIAYFAAVAASSGSCTISLSGSRTPTYDQAMGVAEISGASTVVDVSATATGTGVSLTTTIANDLVMAAIITQGGYDPSAASGFTSLGTSINSNCESAWEYLVATTPGTVTANFASGYAASAGLQAVALKAATSFPVNASNGDWYFCTTTNILYGPVSGGVWPSTGYQLGQAATATPLMDGTGAAGVTTLFARQDHVHPSDTSRVATATTINGHALSSNVTISASDITTGTLPAAQLPSTINATGLQGTAVATTSPSTGQVLEYNGTSWVPANIVGSGTVTSVALTVPSELSVSGSPITSSGTLAITKANQNANIVMAGPASGGAATPGYRALVVADIPAIPESGVTNLTNDLSNRVLTTTTVNGHALSSNVTISASDITTGSLPMAQIPSGGSSSTYLRGDGTWNTPSGSGGSTTLAGDTDVTISSPSNGQVLTYNGTSSKWTNQAATGGGGGGATIITGTNPTPNIGVPNTPTLVQSKLFSGNSPAVTFTSNVSSGDLIVVVVSGSGTGIPNSGFTPTDNLGSGTAYSLITYGTEGGAESYDCAVFAGFATATGSCTVTVTGSRSAYCSGMIIAEFNNILSVTPDATGASSSTTTTAVPLTTTANSDLVIGVAYSSTAETAGTGFTMPQEGTVSGNGSGYLALEYQVLSTAGAINVAFGSITATGQMLAMAFKATYGTAVSGSTGEFYLCTPTNTLVPYVGSSWGTLNPNVVATGTPLPNQMLSYNGSSWVPVSGYTVPPIWTPNVVTSSRALGTVYQNTTGYPLLVVCYFSGNSSVTVLQGITDASSSPTTVVWQMNSASSSGWAFYGMMLVLPNNYYKFAPVGGVTGSAIQSWVEFSLLKGSVASSGSVKASRALGTTYQNTSSSMMFVATQVSGNGAVVTVVSDTSSSPTTQIFTQKISDSATYMTTFCPVLPGHYYKVSAAGGTPVLQDWFEFTWSGVTCTRSPSLTSTRVVPSTASSPYPVRPMVSPNGYVFTNVSGYAAATCTLHVPYDYSPGFATYLAGCGAAELCDHATQNTDVRNVYGLVHPGASIAFYVDSSTFTVSNWFDWLFS